MYRNSVLASDDLSVGGSSLGGAVGENQGLYSISLHRGRDRQVQKAAHKSHHGYGAGSVAPGLRAA